jgi:hypothetical protein
MLGRCYWGLWPGCSIALGGSAPGAVAGGGWSVGWGWAGKRRAWLLGWMKRKGCLICERKRGMTRNVSYNSASWSGSAGWESWVIWSELEAELIFFVRL